MTARVPGPRPRRPRSGSDRAAPTTPTPGVVDHRAGSDVGPRAERSGVSPRRWSLWALPAPALAYVLAVDVLAVVVGAVFGATEPVAAGDLRTALLLALGCAVHIEAARGIERRREVVADGVPYIDLKSMWSFAGLLLLPLGPALVLVVFSFAYWWLRVSQRPVPHRWVFSAATVVLATFAAHLVLRTAAEPEILALISGPTGLLLVAAAGLTRWLVNLWLVVGVISLSAPTTTWRQRFGSSTDTLIGLGALALGAATAVLAASAPWIVPVLLVPVMGMHRGFLVGQFARAARTDGKTGLPTAAHWRDHATREVARARRRGGAYPGLGVLMVDLDQFKAVNDHFGHLVGDAALREVADALRAEVRGYDAVGRFGGEEFVVLLAEVSPAEVGQAAERIRRRIGACEIRVPDGPVRHLTASIGAATLPADAVDLDDLLVAADTALLAAKRSGRDRVEFAARVRSA